MQDEYHNLIIKCIKPKKVPVIAAVIGFVVFKHFLSISISRDFLPSSFKVTLGKTSSYFGWRNHGSERP